jgi:hypothetical protein
LEGEVENAANRRNALNESGDKIRDLTASGDYLARMRLREEIRRRISRIDLFPKGISRQQQEIAEFPVPMPAAKSNGYKPDGLELDLLPVVFLRRIH